MFLQEHCSVSRKHGDLSKVTLQCFVSSVFMFKSSRNTSGRKQITIGSNLVYMR